MSENAQPSGVGVSRRTVTKAMAWTIPTIAVAATVPIAAASGELPKPGDNCKWGAGAVNTFHFYIAQPSQVGDVIVLSGPAFQAGTEIDSSGSCGVTVQETNRTATSVTYTITAIDASVQRPYVFIQDVNATAGVALNVDQTRGGSNIGDWSFYANTDNCKALGWKDCI